MDAGGDEVQEHLGPTVYVSRESPQTKKYRFRPAYREMATVEGYGLGHLQSLLHRLIFIFKQIK